MYLGFVMFPLRSRRVSLNRRPIAAEGTSVQICANGDIHVEAGLERRSKKRWA